MVGALDHVDGIDLHKAQLLDKFLNPLGSAVLSR
jgi:hypothetical protein